MQEGAVSLGGDAFTAEESCAGISNSLRSRMQLTPKPTSGHDPDAVS